MSMKQSRVQMLSLILSHLSGPPQGYCKVGKMHAWYKAVAEAAKVIGQAVGDVFSIAGNIVNGNFGAFGSLNWNKGARKACSFGYENHFKFLEENQGTFVEFHNRVHQECDWAYTSASEIRTCNKDTCEKMCKKHLEKNKYDVSVPCAMAGVKDVPSIFAECVSVCS